MLIKLDSREAKLRALLGSHLTENPLPGVRMESVQLPLGDVVLCDEDEKERVIIERKSLPDLAASIVDGRYREQGRRLQQCGCPPHNIYYLIEGDVNRFRGRCRTVTASTLRSTLISLSFVKGFSVHTVPGVEESARWILKFAARLAAKDAPVGRYDGSQPDGTVTAPKPFVEVCSRVKRDQIGEGNALEIMLSQVPGVSATTAQAVAAAFPTMRSLVDALRADEAALASVRTTASSGQKRRIAANVQKRIASFLGVAPEAES